MKKLYQSLLELHGQQGWWPIVNDNTLICEYHPNDYSYPRTDAERFEICIGAILTQNTGWYPNVVRAIQQLKLGRPFTKEELELIEAVEIHKGVIREKSRKKTTGHIQTQNTSWTNVEKALENLYKQNLLEPKKMGKTQKSIIQECIQPSGYYNQKAKKLKIFTDFFLKLQKAPTRKQLVDLWGIGEETADSILLYAFKVPTFVIDTYTQRFSVEKGLISKPVKYRVLQELFEKNIEPDLATYQEFHALIVKNQKQIKNGKYKK